MIYTNLQGKRGKSTVCIALPDENCDEAKIKMNKVVRMNLKVRLGDLVTVKPCQDLPYGKKVYLYLFIVYRYMFYQ